MTAQGTFRGADQLRRHGDPLFGYQLVKHVARPGVALSFGPQSDLEILLAYEYWPAMFRQFDALYVAALDGTGNPRWVLVADTFGEGWRAIPAEQLPEEVARLLGGHQHSACRAEVRMLWPGRPLLEDPAERRAVFESLARSLYSDPVS